MGFNDGKLKGIIEASQIPENEKVYLKKDFLGWRVIEPVLDPETNKIVWKNVFNLRGMIVLAFILFLLGVGYLAFDEQIDNYKSITENPCLYCKSCVQYGNNDVQFSINLTEYIDE